LLKWLSDGIKVLYSSHWVVSNKKETKDCGYSYWR